MRPNADVWSAACRNRMSADHDGELEQRKPHDGADRRGDLLDQAHGGSWEWLNT